MNLFFTYSKNWTREKSARALGRGHACGPVKRTDLGRGNRF